MVTGKKCPHGTYEVFGDELCTIGRCGLSGNRLIVPTKLRSRLFVFAHDGQIGVVGTKQNLCTKVWWLGMEKYVE